jgi:hypothetical protein
MIEAILLKRTISIIYGKIGHALKNRKLIFHATFKLFYEKENTSRK